MSRPTPRAERVPSICAGCRFAKWEGTPAGRLSFGGAGECMHPFFDAPLPMAARMSMRERSTIAKWRIYRRTTPVSAARETCPTREPGEYVAPETPEVSDA